MLSIDVASHPKVLTNKPLSPRAFILLDVLGGSTASLNALDDGFSMVLLTKPVVPGIDAVAPQANMNDGETVEVAAAEFIVAMEALVRVATAQPVFVGALVNALPLAAQVAAFVERESITELCLVCAGDGETESAANVFAAGVIVTLLLDELTLGASLTDAAGIAISYAKSYDDFRLALSASHRGRLLDATGGSELVTACAQYSSVGIVGAVSSTRDQRFAVTAFVLNPVI